MRFLPVVFSALLLTSTTGAAVAAPAQSAGHGHGHHIHAHGTFAPYTPGANAVTHDPKLAPAGSKAAVSGYTNAHRTKLKLYVKGLLPNREYGSHAHSKPCGAAAADSGPHYQNVVDPVQPSVDPKYANPQNEIWLDFTTDANGAASAVSTVDWGFAAERRAHSVVIHEMHTHTEPGHAGMAGARLACLNVGF
ncbi:superoxide dismutase [Amycolatopsis minnesotensis]|uniref:Cu-Zn family superoxide dismutase n=1 Tax=Amycolatopsis minnesotensis TaxID=337894 RepID=A0ABN2SNR3_9PSEU